MTSLVRGFSIVAIALTALAATPRPGHACGGLFCDNTQPVNQAAERIIFAENGDGTVTAVIEIQYQGAAEQFSWVLPVPGVPDVDVSSVAAFDRLQQQTNPQFNLQTTFEDCGGGDGAAFGNTSGADAPTRATADSVDDQGGVVVLAAGTVGPFDFEVISLDATLDDAADVALDWLGDNGYEVTALAPEVLGPYLEDGLNLLAFRLNKQNDVGSIRPIMITYTSELPFIPIRPTAVAANDDMGVMVFVTSGDRAIPKNYKALELNEALIDWFNPMATYNDVVIAAADEASGQGFVTEYADSSDTLEGVVVQDWERDSWQDLMAREFSEPIQFLFEASDLYSSWDGFQDAVRDGVTLPEGIDIDDFLGCPRCYEGQTGFELDVDAFRLALFDQVIKPMFGTEDLIQSRPYITRLYTTLSAEEMTLDPSFDFNPDLPTVSNVRNADQFIKCDGTFEITLESGDVIFGENQGVWPMAAVADQPAARRIMQLSTQGMGEVVTDNSEVIAGLLSERAPPGGPTGPGGTTSNPGGGDDDGDGGDGGGGLCAVQTGPGAASAWLLIALALLPLRRRSSRNR